MKWLDDILAFKNEADGTRRLAIGAMLVITLALASLSIFGAIANSEGGTFVWFGRIAYAFLVLGLETIASVILVRALLTNDWPRRIVCMVIFAGCAWANVQNATDGVHVIFPKRFAEDSTTLVAKAKLAGLEATSLGTTSQAAVASVPQELERARKEIADIQAEQEIMSAQSPEGISKAQSLLSGQGKYFGHVDGIRKDKTESAMRARGEELSTDYKKAKLREQNLMSGQASPVQDQTHLKSIEQIEIEALARKAAEWAIRLSVILWIAEITRSMGLWAAITSATAKGTNRERERADELEEAEHAARLAAIRGQGKATSEPEADPAAEPTPTAPPAPEPPPESIPEPIAAKEPEAEPEPEPDLLFDTPDPVQPDMSDLQRRARAGGLGAGHGKRAEAAANDRLIEIDDWRERDAVPQMQAAE